MPDLPSLRLHAKHVGHGWCTSAPSQIRFTSRRAGWFGVWRRRGKFPRTPAPGRVGRAERVHQIPSNNALVGLAPLGPPYSPPPNRWTSPRPHVKLRGTFANACPVACRNLAPAHLPSPRRDTVNRFPALLIVSLLAICPSLAAADAPAITWGSDPVRPNETVVLMGGGLESGTVELGRVVDGSSKGGNAPVEQCASIAPLQSSPLCASLLSRPTGNRGYTLAGFAPAIRFPTRFS